MYQVEVLLEKSRHTHAMHAVGGAHREEEREPTLKQWSSIWLLRIMMYHNGKILQNVRVCRVGCVVTCVRGLRNRGRERGRVHGFCRGGREMGVHKQDWFDT